MDASCDAKSLCIRHEADCAHREDKVLAPLSLSEMDFITEKVTRAALPLGFLRVPAPSW
jgi:hypothetical protein